MASTLPKAYIQTYERNVRHLSQQGISRLRPFVMERGEHSAKHNWDRMGKADVSTKTSRGMQTPDNQTPISRRVSTPITKNVGDLVGKEDIVQMLIEPNSNFAMAHAMGMRRGYDAEIIRAAVSESALNGDGGTDTLAASQTVGDGTAPVTFDLVTEVSEIFMGNDVDPDEEKVMVIPPSAARKLLQIAEATSADFNALRPLQSKGYVDNWMGYTWIVSTLLTDGSAAGTSKMAFAMTKRALGFNVNMDISAHTAPDPSASFDYRIYCEATFGAVRVEDEQLVRIDIADSV